MREILLCSNTPGAMNDVGEILLNTGSFEVLDFEKGIDNAAAAVRLATPELLIVNLSDFESNSYVSLLSLRSDLKELPVLVYGTTLEYTQFNAMYMGSSLNQLDKDASDEQIIRTVGRAISMTEDEITAVIGGYRQPSLSRSERHHVLVVDDNAILLRSLKTILQQEYRVTLAKSGEGAIRAINNDKPDVVILDYEMPGMDGYEVLKSIRLSEATRDIKVIFLTGISERDRISEVMKFEPNGYLLKPVNNKTLFASIETTLRE